MREVESLWFEDVTKGFPSIVANEQGSFTTPSFVSFTDKERLIGEAAKNQATMNPRNTVFDIKCVCSVDRCLVETRAEPLF